MKPELLSPAGNFEKLKAAVRYGADAVYLAGNAFGMRSAADNFTNEELFAAADYVHARGKKLYLTVNTMPHGYEYPALREYLYANMTGFVRDYDVDGFRCDVADMVPVAFWEEGARRCRALKSDVVLMCEGLKGDDQISAFDLSYGFYTQWALVDLLAGRKPASELRKAWEQARADFPKGFHWMRCFENHDFANVKPGETRKEAAYGPKLNAAMLATAFLLDGLPMIYNGQEIADAAPHSIWSNRDHGGWHIDWTRGGDAVATERRALVKRLAALRHAHPALFDAPLVWLETEAPDRVYAFRRALPEGDITLAVNVSKEPVSVVLAGERLTLPPQGFRIK